VGREGVNVARARGAARKRKVNSDDRHTRWHNIYSTIIRCERYVTTNCSLKLFVLIVARTDADRYYACLP
jgi:hypothetical protein